MKPFDPIALRIATDLVRQGGMDDEADWFSAMIDKEPKRREREHKSSVERDRTIRRILRELGFFAIVLEGDISLGDRIAGGHPSVFANRFYHEIARWLSVDRRLLKGLRINFRPSTPVVFMTIEMWIHIAGRDFMVSQNYDGRSDFLPYLDQCYDRLLSYIGDALELV